MRRQKICFDEWNVWDPVRAPGEDGAEEQYVIRLCKTWSTLDSNTKHRYNLSDALAVSVWLNVFVRQSKHMGMANIAQSVNVISPLMTTKDGILKQSTWWPLLLFSKYMRGSTVAVNVRGGEYTGETQPAWIRGTIETPWLDVSAALDSEGVLNLAVVNIHEEKDFETELKGLTKGAEVEVHTVSGQDVKVVNTDGKDEVAIKESKWNGEGLFTFPKHSLTLLRWKL